MIGGRVREERVRLLISQADLADQLGVSRGTQFNYENGKGLPDARYLLAFGELGADVGYVLSGERTTPVSMYQFGAARVLPLIAARAKVDVRAILGILDLAAEEAADEWAHGQTVGDGPEKLARLVAALFEDGELLGKIFASIAKKLSDRQANIRPAKKADIILSLYSVSRARGKLDMKMLEIALEAAA